MNTIAVSLYANYFQVGQAAFKYGEYTLARTMFREALEVASRCATSAVHQADSAHALALTLLGTERSEAQQLLRRAVRLYGTVAELDSHVFVGAVSALADSYCEEHFVERALPLLKKAVKIVVAKEGLAAPHLIPLFRRMALIYSKKRYSAKAEHFFRRSYPELVSVTSGADNG